VEERGGGTEQREREVDWVRGIEQGLIGEKQVRERVGGRREVEKAAAAAEEQSREVREGIGGGRKEGEV
jgi:hypothetical protein